jgi:hypothetical protein
MARPRKATSTLRANGAFLINPQREHARSCEPMPTEMLGDPPETMEPQEKVIWRELADLLPRGVATNMDRPSFELMVGLLAQYRHRRGTMKAAEYSLLVGLFGRYGMSPADRSRVQTANFEHSNQLDDFLNRRT